MANNNLSERGEAGGSGVNGAPWVDEEGDWRRGSRAYALPETAGRNIDWHNESHNWDKAADVEILSATVYDTQFVAMHHRVRDLLEANAILTHQNKIIHTRPGKFGEKRWAQGLTTPQVYEHILSGKEMTVNLTDENGEETGETINLKDYAQYLRMLDFNRLMGEYALPEEELEKRFLAKEEIKVTVIPKDRHGVPTGEPPRVIDYYKKNPVDNMAGFDAKKYLQTIRDRQVGLQSIGNLRDEALKGLHPENAGHVKFFELILNGRKEWLWMPTSSKIAKDYVSTDMRKISPATLAKFHVHGVGLYDEKTSASAGFDFDILQSQRKDIKAERDFRDTNARMVENSMGLASGESALVRVGQDIANVPIRHKDTKEIIRYENKKLSVVQFGKDRRGKVYDALHNTYDEAMKITRGFALTEEEADDKIMTDIIIPVLINNPRDWMMCFARAFGGKIGLEVAESVKATAGDWAAKNFCLEVRCRETDKNSADYGKVLPKLFFSIDQLIDYANKRVATGEILGVPDTESAKFNPQSKEEEEAEKKADEEDKKKKEEDKAEEIKELGETQLRAYTALLKAVFGAGINPYLRDYWEKGDDTQVVDVKRKPVLDESGNQVVDATGQPVFDESEQVAEGTGRQNFVELLRKKLRQNIGKYSSLITDASGSVGGENGLDMIVETLNHLSKEGRKKLYEFVVPPALRMTEGTATMSAATLKPDPKEPKKQPK